ncbi:MAG: hypothetical protein M3Z32_07385 [Acidobacteriota bacterium]|nr:hypothetical protein [Acidobacteriota bacterium]
MRNIGWSVALLACSVPLFGTTLQQLSLDDMIRKSTEVVRGKVQCTGSAVRGAIVYTNYRVQVSEQWKGSPQAQIDVSVPGGLSGGIRQTYSGAPALSDGQEFVLFLWTSKTGLRQIIGLSQGVFTVQPVAGGGMTASRAAITEQMVGSNGQPVQDTAFGMPVNDLRNRVLTTLSGRSSQ